MDKHKEEKTNLIEHFEYGIISIVKYSHTAWIEAIFFTTSTI